MSPGSCRKAAVRMPARAGQQDSHRSTTCFPSLNSQQQVQAFYSMTLAYLSHALAAGLLSQVLVHAPSQAGVDGQATDAQHHCLPASSELTPSVTRPTQMAHGVLPMLQSSDAGRGDQPLMVPDIDHSVKRLIWVRVKWCRYRDAGSSSQHA